MRNFLAAGVLLAFPLWAVSAEPPCAPAGTLEITGLSTPADDLARVAELAGAVAPSSRLLRRGAVRAETICADAAFPWPPFARPFAAPEHEPAGAAPPVTAPARHEPVEGRGATARTLPVRLTTIWSSTYPAGDNDGLLWAGRGVSQLLSAGATLRWGSLSASVAPELSWSENRAFDLVANGETGDLRFRNGYYGNAIDLPQRFGSGPLATWAPGQSYVRFDRWNVAVGLSSENLWFGPGIRNSIAMSNAGPGFPHVFLGTSRPGDIWIGKAEALLFWGRLERTRYVEGGGHPLLSGVALTYEPRWIPGLSLGLARVFVQPWDGRTLRDYLAVFQAFDKKSVDSSRGLDGDNPEDNQLASVFARWTFPQVGLEIYGEWAREDHERTWWNLVREPDHSQAYLLGLQKVFRAGARIVRFHAELAHLQELRPLANERGVPIYYIHSGDLGYTNRGQLLGAWIGPGADSQTLAVDLFHRGGRIGGYLERVRRNDAYYWSVVEPVRGNVSHDAEVVLGFRQALAVGSLEVSWDAAVANRLNRDFIRNEPNLRLGLTLAMPLRRR